MAGLKVLLFSVLFFSQFGVAANFVKKLEKEIKKSGLTSGHLGVLVMKHDGTVLYSLNSKEPGIPASLTKIVTTAAVLNEFPSTHQFVTQLWGKGSREEQTYKGDIYLKGFGDPAFVSEKMWMLINDFTRERIKKITGDIVIDDTYFDNERFDEGRDAGGNDRAYDSPVGAVSFNWNSTTVIIRPGKSSKDKALVFINPENDYVKVENNAKTTSGKTNLSVERVDGDKGDTIRVSGNINLNESEKVFYKAITSPPLYTGFCFKEFARQRGIEIEGGVKLGKVPSGAEMFLEFKGDRLNKILGDLNKFSNNYVAEMLVKGLAASHNTPGTMAHGLERVRSFAQKELGFAPEAFSLVNVSGLTRKNRLSPEQLTKTLQWIYKRFQVSPEFLQSLPLSGMDGTLERRMSQIKGQVRAKTGLLDGAVGLAGYAENPEIKDTLIFAFLYNGKKDGGMVRSEFDDWAAKLVND